MSATCPTCHMSIPGGSRAGHCTGCHRNFSGDAAFEAHLERPADASRPVHHDPATATDRKGRLRPFWQDERGTWHHGPRRPDHTY